MFQTKTRTFTGEKGGGGHVFNQKSRISGFQCLKSLTSKIQNNILHYYASVRGDKWPKWGAKITRACYYDEISPLLSPFLLTEPILIYDAETVASNKRSNLFTATDKEFSLTPNINKSNSKSAKGNDLKSTNKGSKMKSTLKERGSKSITKGIDLKSTTKGSNLMIVSYMRGGSSMNGKVFGENPESLYVFEPLSKFAPHHYFTDNEQCSMSEKQCR